MAKRDKHGHNNNTARDLGKKIRSRFRREKGHSALQSGEPVTIDESWEAAFLDGIDRTLIDPCKDGGLKITPHKGGGTYIAIEHLDLIDALDFFDIENHVEQPGKWIRSITIPSAGVQTMLQTFDPFGRNLYKPKYEKLRTILTPFKQAPQSSAQQTTPATSSVPAPQPPRENAL